ncbi:MAG: MarR family transcriptional regulator [Erysipelotrichaceae bacterium]|jgi:DNA-binding MarR family transcriptional regulator|nr:MarR family transcriptional regulator [Erysipelotrichaceae bacterium]
MDQLYLRSFMNIFLLANRLQSLMDKELTDITVKQWVALIMLGTFEKPPLLSQLADKCGITHQSMMSLVKRLAEKGYAVIEKDASDRRALRIRPTVKREQWALQYAKQNQENILGMFADFTEEEFKEFVKAQDKLYYRLGEMGGELYEKQT